MFVSTNPLIIVVHILALVCFILAVGVPRRDNTGVPARGMNLVALGLALLTLVLVLADFGVFK